MSDDLLPTVQLLHALPDGTTHIDWMISPHQAGEEPLITFRCARRVDLLMQDATLPLERIDDHRPAYLTYEGPISGGRGEVRRVARGLVSDFTRRPDRWSLTVAWHAGPEQRLRLDRERPDGWTVRAEHVVLNSPIGTMTSRQRGAVMDKQNPGTPGRPSKIQHRAPGFGSEPSAPSKPVEPAEVPVVAASGLSGTNKITAIEPARRHEENWARMPNTTGTGAIHVRSFHCKLTDDALVYMDQTINEWLDAHPQYEVKFVNTSIGVLTGKLKEPHMICQVWV